MPKFTRNFVAGKMNKTFDERVVPNGEYIDAMNIRMGSTENSEFGVIENTKGNISLTTLRFENTLLSVDARCIGAYEDGSIETIYWFVHDPSFPLGATGKLDLIVSFNTNTLILAYHVITIDNGYGVDTTLNFNPQYLITGVNKIEDLLFFTDNYNAPRSININRNYAIPVGFIDAGSPTAALLLEESLLVIKKPPVESPTVLLLNTIGEQNFIEERFISFAYRYLYADGQYSATSQWSDIAFTPNGFQLTIEAYLNEGMINAFNACEVTYYTGNSLVLGIDLLFKQSESNIIKIIEKQNKADLGIPNNTYKTLTFDNSKIFTVLPEAELLRLYDNVPRFAQAQTLMGNRLMYGNYIEGYDLISIDGQPLQLTYIANLIQENASSQTLDSFGEPALFNIDPIFQGTYIPDGILRIDFSSLGPTYNLNLIQGASIQIELQFVHDFFTGANAVPITSGLNTFGVAFQLIDSLANFVLAGVSIGDVVTNNSIGGTATVTSVLATQLGLSANIFTSVSQSYTINPLIVPPTQTTPNTDISATFIIQETSYASPYALSQSDEFQAWVGTLVNILPVYDPNPLNPTSCSGSTVTDNFNCAVPQFLSVGFEKRASGIDAINEPIKIIASGSSPYIDLQLVAMQYEDTNNLGDYVYEYYKVVTSIVTFLKLGNARSLHSNRGYEIGIVYMDDFLRSSTALVSPLNSVYTPCSSSPSKNSIRVEIPVSQVAPYWATRYKFVIKPDQEGYQTIYSTLVVEDNGLFWFLLEGENMQKIEVGDRIIVKKDSAGPTASCIYTTVLEKIAKQITTSFIVQGVYMRLEATNFNVDAQNTIPEVSDDAASFSDQNTAIWIDWSDPDYPVPPALLYTDLDVPAGSTISFMLYTFRPKDVGCSKRELNAGKKWKTFTATSNYASIEDWFEANDVSILTAFNTLQDVDMNVEYMGVSSYADEITMYNHVGGLQSPSTYRLYINRYPSNNRLTFWVSGAKPCAAFNKKVKTEIKFKLNRNDLDPDFIFETLPIDALPDVFFENNLSFAINPTTGEHDGNVANQNFALGQPAIIDTGFFNCFSFGNGAESYKVRDSIVGREFNLGERVTSVSAQDYKEAHRFSDITYSGIFNPESNLNKLNEFNLGLLNYKYLESSFGYIYILDGRETDVLCLQEDKISYVLAGKNLLSDAAAGRALTAVPEVLGTQIARTEKYGISHNPESYVQWGADRYFTDVKRGAVIHIQGDSMQSDQLQVVSEFGMRTWFRDEFINAQTTQKLGGYDPYMNEYVLTSNDIQVPSVIECIGCGQINSITIDNTDKPETIISYCIKVEQCIGTGNIVLTTFAPSSGLISIDVTYDGTTTSNNINGIGTISVPYSVDNPLVFEVQIVVTIAAGANVTFEIDNQCQECTPINLIQVVITDGVNSGMFIHNQYNYFDPLIPYSSPLQSNQVTFALPNYNPLVSYYNIDAGFWGQGSFPYPNAEINVYTNKFGFDDFDVTDPPNKFRWHTSNIYYPNNQIDITTLLSLSTDITPLVNTLNQWKGTFTTPTLDNFLYLIWDLRQSTAVELCFDREDCAVVCAECYIPPPCDCGSWLVVNASREEFSNVPYENCDGDLSVIGAEGSYGYTFPVDGAIFICAKDFPEEYRVHGFYYIYLGCFCCYDECINFNVTNNGNRNIVFEGKLDCASEADTSILFTAFDTINICLNNYNDLGYFVITDGINSINNLDFHILNCGCEPICCSTYYIFNPPVENQFITYIDCDGILINSVVKRNSGYFICASEITDYGTCIVTQLNECICCETECYTVTATNNGAYSVSFSAAPDTCFGAPNTIMPLESQTWCVSGAVEIQAINFGESAIDIDIEFNECNCPH